MPPSTRLSNLVQYTTLAASTAQGIADAVQVPFLGVIGALSLEIAKGTAAIVSHNEAWFRMLDEIHEILCTIISLYSVTETDGVLPPDFLHDLGKFLESVPLFLPSTLQKIYTVMKTQHGMGRIKRLFKQADISTRMEVCQGELHHSLNGFRARMGISVVVGMTQMNKNAEDAHEKLLALLNTHPELTNSESSSIITSEQSTFSTSSGSLSMLPAPPQIFHGRDNELQEIVSNLLQDDARIAILGAGGMGKTTLATAVIHNTNVVAKYQQRYFVACHSSATYDDTVANIASHIGVEKGPNLVKKVLHHLKFSGPSLLVLDNLETVWEPVNNTTKIEDLLALLADIPQVAIIITMRGAERPNKVKWSRPFLAPLEPLSDAAALQMFTEIADDVHDESGVKELLALTDNLPLAVSLIAGVAEAEGCESALARWTTESTQIISTGYDQRSSLEISIMLSLYSSRMTPEAQQLLSVLSLLPDGLSDADLVQIPLPIPKILSCKSSLLQTSLAYMGNDRRLKVLGPIREHISRSFPPSAELKSPVLAHFQSIVGVWEPSIGSQPLVVQITRNLGNINNLLSDLLLHAEEPDMSGLAATVITLNQFYRHMGRGSSPLMTVVAERQTVWQNSPVFGSYMCERLDTCLEVPLSEPTTQIAQGHQFFEHCNDLEQAKWFNSLGVYYSLQGNDVAMAQNCCQKVLALSRTASAPSRSTQHALRRMAHLKYLSGDHVAGKLYAEEALKCAEALGNIHLQAQSISVYAICCATLGDYMSAVRLNTEAKGLLDLCGLHDGNLYAVVENNIAEVHRLKTEYIQSRSIIAEQISRTRGQVLTTTTALLHLNLALVDIGAGGDPALIRKNIDICRLLFLRIGSPLGKLYCDTADADLQLLEGDIAAARNLFQASVAIARKQRSPEALGFCLERLANLTHGMYSLPATMRWGTVFLAVSLKSKDNLSSMKALRCLAISSVAQGDDDTALSLFAVALDGFTLMDVHRWRADCMVQIAEISQRRGEVFKSMELFEAARPLFEKSSQVKDVAYVDDKLSKMGEHLAEFAALKAPTGRVVKEDEEGHAAPIVLVDSNRDESILDEAGAGGEGWPRRSGILDVTDTVSGDCGHGASDSGIRYEGNRMMGPRRGRDHW
ncbi:hypothetical protein DFH09DRAFT_1407541 [Mycena vulgaris]|nr:hypothetical protein DFH09DRAFT_1407541 [Mycena vulgaris]